MAHPKHLNFAVNLDQAQARGLTHQDVADVQLLVQDVVALALTLRPERRGAVRNQLVDLLVGDVALTPLDMKRARLEAQALRAIRHSTEWLTAADIADLAGLGPANPIGTISRWKQQGRIFALRHDGKDHHPKYALGADFRPLPVVKDILAVLTVYHPELLATKPAKALAAARHRVEVQEHHG